jgi:hypothetical protein
MQIFACPCWVKRGRLGNLRYELLMIKSRVDQSVEDILEDSHLVGQLRGFGNYHIILVAYKISEMNLSFSWRRVIS